LYIGIIKHSVNVGVSMRVADIDVRTLQLAVHGPLLSRTPTMLAVQQFGE